MSAAPVDILPHLRLYAAPFSHHPPAIVSRFPGGKNPLFPFDIGSDKGLGVLLLCASLYRPGGEVRAARLVAELYAQLGNDIFKLNRIPFETLQKALADFSDGPEVEGQKQIPGILRSVCDFFYHVGSLGKWLAASADWELPVRELSNGIYWMGKHSRWRTKSRYFLWLVSFEPGFADRFPQAASFLWPAGEGHFRFDHDILRNKAKQTAKQALQSDPEVRLRFFAALGEEVFPGEAWRFYQPVDSYLRPDKEHEYLCRKIQGGCPSCPLVKLCPAAKYFRASR